MATLTDVQHFLGRRRLAIVGVSRNDRDFTRVLFREFVKRGYDAVPVHPGVAEIEGRPCFGHIGEIAPPVDTALVLTPAAVTNEVVHDCAAAGVTHVWMFRAAGAGAVSPEAVAFCRSQGIRLVDGECPFMFFRGSGFIHQVHRLIRRITGRYPN